MKGINIVDVLKNKPEVKPEETEQKPVTTTQVNADDFEEPAPAKPVEQPPVKPEGEAAAPEPEDDFNYENSSDAMIDMIDTFQKSIFILLGARKMKKKIPEKFIEECTVLDMRDVSGETLTPAEKKKLDKYKAFHRRFERFVQETPFTEEEREEMDRATLAFAKDGKIQISPGLWFGAKVASVLSKRVISLLTD